MTRREWLLPESSREAPAQCRQRAARAARWRGGEERLGKLQETRLQGAGETSAGHGHLAPGEPLAPGKTLHSFAPNVGSGYSSSLPEPNKQLLFKKLPYALFFLEKKTHSKSRGFTL